MSKEAISFWNETLTVLSGNGKSWDDVTDIRVGERQMSKEDFEQHAKDIVYRPWLYGGNTITLKLRMYGDDFIMVRQEYDGSEWWEFLGTKPAEPNGIAKSYGDLLE